MESKARSTTKILPPTARGIADAAGILRRGGLVAFPTETVYGLGADACDDVALAGIFEAKGRPRFNPLICHIADVEAALAIAAFSEEGLALAEAFWPGPLTLVGRRRSGGDAHDTARIGARIGDLATAGLDTVGLRAPDHPLAQALVAAFDGPIAAPSANPSGKLSPTCAEHVLDGLGGRIDAVLDGGATAIGVESTIVLATEGESALLRPGGVALEAIEDTLRRTIAVDASASGREPAPTAPGQLASHYAPRARVRLNATAPRPGEAWLGFGPDPAEAEAAAAAHNLSPSRDLKEAAARLFMLLRSLDAALTDRVGVDGVIATAPIPMAGLGRAINDRLSRAAAPR